jgi:hypothetical protein
MRIRVPALVVCTSMLWMLSAVALPAAQEKAAGIAGQWELTVSSPHGDVPMSMDLKQDGKKVSGTLTSGQGDRQVNGTFDEGRLSLEATGGEQAWTITAKLGSDGQLQGHVSASMGDMKFTGRRAGK